MVHGSKGAPLTPAELIATESIRGGADAITPEVDKHASPSKRQAKREKGEARKKRAKAEREELHWLRGGGGGKDQGGSSKGGKGNSKGEQLCFSWNNGSGPCAGLEPGAECRNRVKCTNARCAARWLIHRSRAHRHRRREEQRRGQLMDEVASTFIISKFSQRSST